MKTCAHRNTIGGLINERLAAIGAANIPTNARQLIEDQIWAAVSALIQRRVSAPVVGRAVARALAAPAATPGQGLKGGTPLTSSGSAQNAQNHVAGHHPNDQTDTAAADTTGTENLPGGERP